MMDYKELIIKFLKEANATCEIVYGGIARNDLWKEKDKRNWYDVTITTPYGSMQYMFWDSIHNTEILMMGLDDYVKKNLKRNPLDITYFEKTKALKQLAGLKEKAVPTAYDVICCLTMYDVGTFEEFCSDYGYDEDSRRAEKIYIACIKEYKDLTRIFSEDQLAELISLCSDY